MTLEQLPTRGRRPTPLGSRTSRSGGFRETRSAGRAGSAGRAARRTAAQFYLFSCCGPHARCRLTQPQRAGAYHTNFRLGSVQSSGGNSFVAFVSSASSTPSLRRSVNHLVVQLVHKFEVRNFQGAHSLNRGSEGLIGAARRIRLSYELSCRPKDAEHLRPIESLTFTVIAETHGRPSPPLSADESDARFDASCQSAVWLSWHSTWSSATTRCPHESRDLRPRQHV